MKIKIVDTTLRDGEQAPGVAFTQSEKEEIALFLDSIGVDAIEVGTPAMGADEQKSIERILNLDLRADIVTWNRATISDMQKSIECGSRFIHISLPVSDLLINCKLNKNRIWILDRLKKSCDYLSREGVDFSVGAEDAARADIGFLTKYAQIAKDAGALRFRYCDTVGILNPFTLFEKVSELKRRVSIPVEVHTHNDFGMATANTLAGIRAGAEFIDTTFTGIGERAGNTALEEVVMALRYTMGIKLNINTVLFREFTKYITRVLGREPAPWKSIIGSNVFAHESGIHVDAVLKNPITYEPFPPEEVGNSRKLVIGKHSGKHAIRDRFIQLGIKLDEGESVMILQKVRKSAEMMKGPVPDGELMRIYQNIGSTA